MNWLYSNLFHHVMSYDIFGVVFYFLLGLLVWALVGTFVYYARYNAASWYTKDDDDDEPQYWTRKEVEESAMMWGYIWPLVLLFYVLKWLLIPVISLVLLLIETWTSFANYVVTLFYGPRRAKEKASG